MLRTVREGATLWEALLPPEALVMPAELEAVDLLTCLVTRWRWAAALQGGSLLARTTRDVAWLEVALDLVLSDLRSHSAR